MRTSSRYKSRRRSSPHSGPPHRAIRNLQQTSLKKPHRGVDCEHSTSEQRRQPNRRWPIAAMEKNRNSGCAPTAASSAFSFCVPPPNAVHPSQSENAASSVFNLLAIGGTSKGRWHTRPKNTYAKARINCWKHRIAAILEACQGQRLIFESFTPGANRRR